MDSPTRLRVIAAIVLTVCSVAGVQTASAAVSTIYRLNQKSTYQEGCFPPCLCPISQPALVRGTFVLTPEVQSDGFATYNVTDVNWTYVMGNQEVQVTGSGTYEVGGSSQQRLQLQLTVGDQPAVQFDSGLVGAKTTFPNIVVTISIHGERCFDQVFTVNASPVPLAEIHPYQLILDSSFQRGCFPPCACAIGPQQPLSGDFTLVDLQPTPLFAEFAVATVNWLAAAPPAAIPVHGVGFYQVGGEVAAQQELSLELTVGNEPQTRFDSGLVLTRAVFPLIDVTISIHGMRCNDTVMIVKAAPKRPDARFSEDVGPCQAAPGWRTRTSTDVSLPRSESVRRSRLGNSRATLA